MNKRLVSWTTTLIYTIQLRAVHSQREVATVYFENRNANIHPEKLDNL